MPIVECPTVVRPLAPWACVAFTMIAGNLVKGYEQKYTLLPTSTGTRLTCFENVTLPFGILGKFAELFRRPISEAHYCQYKLQ